MKNSLSGHKFEQTPGDNEGQGSLVCFSPWGDKESDTTERLKNNNKIFSCFFFLFPFFFLYIGKYNAISNYFALLKSSHGQNQL